jgi:hypothetical protein
LTDRKDYISVVSVHHVSLMALVNSRPREELRDQNIVLFISPGLAKCRVGPVNELLEDAKACLAAAMKMFALLIW